MATFTNPPLLFITTNPDLITVSGGIRKNTPDGGRSTGKRQWPPGKTGASKTKVSRRRVEPASERASLIRPPSLQSIPLLQISKGR